MSDGAVQRRRSRAVRRNALRAAFFLWVSLCSWPSSFAHAAQFSFAALGDTPYNASEELYFGTMLEEMNRKPLAFTLHVGDFKNARSDCSDELFERRRRSFSQSRHPFVFVPGDNEWTDCSTAEHPREPLERLAKLREVFFSRGATLGERTLRVEQQSAPSYAEHLRWVLHDVLFATFNVPGPDNHVSRMPDEARRRTGAVLEWMRETFRIARKNKHAGVVLAMHANIWTGRRAYAEIVSALAAEARAYEGEILLVHGDTHWFRFDRPLAARNINNLQRLEVFGSPFATWTLVTVTVEAGRARFDVTPGGGSGTQPAAGER
jgi:hypothetical protein